jgi:hypothetical protein
MKKLICNILLTWFLLIYGTGDGVAITAIPMENQTYCEMAIANLKDSVSTWAYHFQHRCVDAGQVSLKS